MRCEVDAFDKTAEDLEHKARWHNTEILYWHVKKLRGNSLSEHVPVKDRNVVISKELKREW